MKLGPGSDGKARKDTTKTNLTVSKMSFFPMQEIYDVFLNLDVHNTSYIHEVGRQTTQLYDKMAMLVAHPLQRPPQTQCQYNIFRDVE